MYNSEKSKEELLSRIRTEISIDAKEIISKIVIIVNQVRCKHDFVKGEGVA